MPQIAQIGDIYVSQLFWLAIFFGAIFIVVGLGMLPKIQATVDSRDQRIAADLRQAEQLRAEADRLEAGYRERMDRSRAEAARLAAEAKAGAARETETKVKAADEQLQSRLAAAQGRIAEARSAALADLEAVAAEAAQQMIERVAGLAVDPPAVRSAVQQELAHG